MQGGKKMVQRSYIRKGKFYFVLKSRKIVKDNKDLWGSLFSENSWKGSECAIINPIKMYEKFGFYYVELIILKMFQTKFEFIRKPSEFFMQHTKI